MTKHRILLTLIFALQLVLSNTYATIPTSVDRTQMAPGESFNLIIEASGNSRPDITPLYQDFDVFGTSTSSSLQVINGVTTSDRKIIISLAPRFSGKLTIPALKIGHDTTREIPITVTVKAISLTTINKGPVFLKASLKKTKGYINSPLLYTIKLYYNNQLSGGQITPPQNNALTIRPIENSKKYHVNLNGKVYNVVEKFFLITPEKSGNININPAYFRGTLSNNQMGYFSSLYIAPDKPINAKSNSVKYRVLPIPKGVSTQAWFPAKKVTLTSSWTPENKTFTAGTPVTRTITITAKGVDSRMIPNLSLQPPANTNAYPDKTQINDKINNQTIIATKSYKIAYIPTQSGKIIFPKIQLKWWDSTSGKLHTESVARQAFNVAPSATPAQMIITPTQPSSQTASLAPPTSTQSPASQPQYWWKTLFYSLLALWLITLLTWYATHKFRAKTKRNPKNSSETQVSLKKLSKQLKSACKSNQAPLIQKALIAWSADHFNDHHIRSIIGVRQHITDSNVAQELTRLERALYHNEQYHSGEPLWNALHHFLTTHSNDKDSSFLKPMYPD